MHRLPPIAAIAVILACIALRVAALPTLQTPRHDDAISYLAATGHQRDYAEITWRPEPPYGHWSSAADWQRLWSLDDRFCFRRIAADLGQYDIHPPLYFWLLHLWLVAFGVTVRSGPTLNLLLCAGTLFFVYRLGRHVSGSTGAGLVAALIWGGSRATLAVTLAARQYELLGLLAAAFLWRLVWTSDPARTPRARELWLLGACAAAGMLTHHHFALLLLGSAAATWWRLRDSVRRRNLVLASLAAGLFLPLLIHPYLLGDLRRSENRELFDWSAVPARVMDVLEGVAIFGGHGWMQWVWGFALAAAAATLLLPSMRAGRSRPALDRTSSIATLLVITAVLALATGALYAAMVTPKHAVGWRYFTLLWSLLAVLVAALLWRSRAGRFMASALSIALLVASVNWLRHERRHVTQAVTPDPRRPLLIDNATEGVLPTVLWHVAPETRVFAAHQRHLLEHPADWLDTLGDRPIYAATAIEFGTRAELRERLLALLRSRYREEENAGRSRTAEWIGWRRINDPQDQ